MDKEKEYQVPDVVHEGELEAQAGTPWEALPGVPEPDTETESA